MIHQVEVGIKCVITYWCNFKKGIFLQVIIFQFVLSTRVFGVCVCVPVHTCMCAHMSTYIKCVFLGGILLKANGYDHCGFSDRRSFQCHDIMV